MHYDIMPSLGFLCLVRIGFQDDMPVPLYSCVAGNLGICPLTQTLTVDYGQAIILLLLWLGYHTM